MSHFYNKQGESVFEITGKNGKKRKPTIRDCRELDLLPSVTTVMSILAAKELEDWKINQVLKAAANNFFYVKGDGTLQLAQFESFKERVLKEAFEKSETAKDFGDLLHKYLENRLTGRYPDLEYPDIPQATKDAIGVEFKRIKRVIYIEHAVVDHDLGVAGRLDLFCELTDGRTCLADFKNQTTLKEDGTPRKIVVYNKSKMQASEYGKIVNADCVAVMTVSRDQAGRVEWYELTPEEYEDSKKMFRHVVGMYRLDNKLRGIKEEEDV